MEEEKEEEEANNESMAMNAAKPADKKLFSQRKCQVG